MRLPPISKEELIDIETVKFLQSCAAGLFEDHECHVWPASCHPIIYNPEKSKDKYYIYLMLL